MSDEKLLDISWGTIVKIGTAILIFYLLYVIRDILVWIIFALIISFLFNPAINFLNRRHIPRLISVIFVYVAIFGFFILIIYLIAPLFISEIQQFSQFLPQYFEKIAPALRGLGIEAFKSFEIFIQSLQGWLIKASTGLLGALSAIFGGIFSALTIFTLALFFSIEEKDLERTIKLISPRKYEDFVLNIWHSCQNKVSIWFGTKILGCVFVSVASFISFHLFKIDYSLALSLFAGVSNIIPIIGPVLAGIMIVIIAAFDSWLKAVFILLVFLLIQQIESNILMPFLTKRFIGISPALVLVALLIGGKLWGVLGAVLTIPLLVAIVEFSKDFLKRTKEESKAESETV